MKISLFMLSSFLLGVVVGVYKVLPKDLLEFDFTMYALYILLLLVGFSIGCNEKAIKSIITIGFRAVLVPLSVVAGTLLGVLLVIPLLSHITIRDAIAVGFGFGYYSLSSVIITQMRGETLGAIALLSNMIRELGTILLTPLFVKYLGKISSIAAGGATSMDTTLPIHVKFAGKEYALTAIFSGIVLTISVPFLIVFILR